MRYLLFVLLLLLLNSCDSVEPPQLAVENTYPIDLKQAVLGESLTISRSPSTGKHRMHWGDYSGPINQQKVLELVGREKQEDLPQTSKYVYLKIAKNADYRKVEQVVHAFRSTFSYPLAFVVETTEGERQVPFSPPPLSADHNKGVQLYAKQKGLETDDAETIATHYYTRGEMSPNNSQETPQDSQQVEDNTNPPLPPPPPMPPSFKEETANVQYTIAIEADKLTINNKEEILQEALTEHLLEQLTANTKKLDNFVLLLKVGTDVSYRTFVEVYQSIRTAYYQLRDTQARNRFDIAFENLSPEQKKEMKERYPMRVLIPNYFEQLSMEE